MDCYIGYVKGMERIRVPYTIVKSSHLEPMEKLKLLIMPWPLIVSPEAADRIVEFAENGKWVVFQALKLR